MNLDHGVLTIKCVSGSWEIRFLPDNRVSSWIRARGNTVSACYATVLCCIVPSPPKGPES